MDYFIQPTDSLAPMKTKKLLITIIIISTIIMATCEALKALYLPNIPTWLSYIMTIGLTSIIVATCTYFVAKHIEALQARAIEKQVKVFRTTMQRTMDIVGNFLNNMLYFKESLDSMPQEEKKLYYEIVQNTDDKLKELGQLEKVILDELSKTRPIKLPPKKS